MTGDRIPDAGAQAERTALSWQRTGLGALAVGALMIHTDPARNPLSSWPGVLLMAVGAVCVAVLAPLRYRRVLRAIGAGRAPASTLTIHALSAVLVVVTIGAGSALLLASPGVAAHADATQADTAPSVGIRSSIGSEVVGDTPGLVRDSHWLLRNSTPTRPARQTSPSISSRPV